MKSRRQDTKAEKRDRKDDILETLRAENRKLKKKIGQLQKQVTKFSATQCLSDWDEDQPIFPKPPSEQKKVKSACPKCSGKITKISAGLYLIKVCFECGWKKRQLSEGEESS
jgi:DNA-directed RNA polymerase subunit RPC12/RpoP